MFVAPVCTAVLVVQLWAALPSAGVLQPPNGDFITVAAHVVGRYASGLLGSSAPFVTSLYVSSALPKSYTDPSVPPQMPLPDEKTAAATAFRSRYAIMLLSRSPLCPPLALRQDGTGKLKRVRAAADSGAVRSGAPCGHDCPVHWCLLCLVGACVCCLAQATVEVYIRLAPLLVAARLLDLASLGTPRHVQHRVLHHAMYCLERIRKEPWRGLPRCSLDG